MGAIKARDVEANVALLEMTQPISFPATDSAFGFTLTLISVYVLIRMQRAAGRIAAAPGSIRTAGRTPAATGEDRCEV